MQRSAGSIRSKYAKATTASTARARITIAAQMGWSKLENGELLRAAERAGFDVLMAGDKNIVYQQNNAERKIGLIVLSQTRRKPVLENAERVAAALTRVCPGSFEVVEITSPRRKSQSGPSKTA